MFSGVQIILIGVPKASNHQDLKTISTRRWIY